MTSVLLSIQVELCRSPELFPPLFGGLEGQLLLLCPGLAKVLLVLARQDLGCHADPVEVAPAAIVILMISVEVLRYLHR